MLLKEHRTYLRFYYRGANYHEFRIGNHTFFIKRRSKNAKKTFSYLKER